MRRLREGFSLMRFWVRSGLAVIAVLLVWSTVTRAAVLTPTAMQNFYVTSDSAGSHTTTPAVNAFGVNVDGVAELIVSTPRGTFGGTGSLLLGGQSLLTAAHVVSNSSGVVDATNVQVIFHTSAGTVILNSSVVAKNASYDGNTSHGNDLAVVTLSAPVVSTVPRYDIYRGTSEIGATSVKVGYGLSGIGSSGTNSVSFPFGTKRAGLNEYDRDARDVLSALGGGSNPFGGSLPNAGLTIAYDFDSGSANNNAFAFNPINYGSDLGFGADEVGAAPGDSGGPTFILDSGVYKIAGVTSYGFGFNGLPDSSPGTNSSWGEVAVDARVAGYQSFIDSLLPEPTALGTITFALTAMILRRRRVAA
jgi:secreted trypsin-like serine protease